MTPLYVRCNEYLNQRKGTYAFRCFRYDSVIDKLFSLGVTKDDLVVDVGAGRCEFNHRCHERGLSIRYLPVDGSIDSTDLNLWRPKVKPEFFVAIEILEHLHDPARLMFEMEYQAVKGIVVTVPNPETVDVLGIDSTHVTPIRASDFKSCTWETEIKSHFGKPKDSILAWWKKVTQ